MKNKLTKRILSFFLALLTFATTIPSACMQALADTGSGQTSVYSYQNLSLHYTKIVGRNGKYIDNYYKPQAIEKDTNAPDYMWMEIKTVSNNANDAVCSENCVPIYRISRRGGMTDVQSTVTSNEVINYDINSLGNFVNQMNRLSKDNRAILDEKKAKMIYYVLQNGLKQFSSDNGYGDNLYYIATQAIIWEISEGKRTGWGNDATTTKYGQPFPANFNSNTYQTRNGKYYNDSAAWRSRSGLSGSYCSSGNINPYPYYWHDWYYTVKSVCFDKAYCDMYNTDTSWYSDYYDQILKACALQAAADDTQSWTNGMVNNNYTMSYNADTGYYETKVTLGSKFKGIIGENRGVFFDYNRIVVPIRAYNKYSRDDGTAEGYQYNDSYFIQHDAVDLSKTSEYTVNIDTNIYGEYYHLNVRSYPDSAYTTYRLQQGTVLNNQVTILGQTANGKYYYIKYRLKNDPNTDRYAYIEKGQKTYQHPSTKQRNTQTTDVLQLATYDNGRVIYPSPLYTITYSNLDKLNGVFYIKTNSAVDPAATFYWDCNGVPSGYYNQTFAFNGNPSSSTAKEKGIQGFACGGNPVSGKVSFNVTEDSIQQIVVKAKIDGTESFPDTVNDVIWNVNIPNDYVVKKEMTALKSNHCFYGDEQVIGTDNDYNTYLSNYLYKLETATGKEYDILKWTDAAGNEIEFDSSGISGLKLSNGGTIYIVFKEKAMVTDTFLCNGVPVATRSGYVGSSYNMPTNSGENWQIDVNCEFAFDTQNKGWQLAFWDKLAGDPSKNNVPEARKIYPGQENKFGRVGKTYYAKYEKTDNRRVFFMCGIDNALVYSAQGLPGTEYTAPDGASHIQDKCNIPDFVTINGKTYNKEDLTFTFAYWDTDSTSILAKPKIPSDAITPDNYNQTIPNSSTTYYAKYEIDCKKNVEFKCAVCGETIYSVNDFGGTQVMTPDKVNGVNEDGTITDKSLLDAHVCKGQITINGKTTDVSSLNQTFNCYSKISDNFNYNDPVLGSVVFVPTGVLTDENQTTTYYVHYDFQTKLTVTSHLKDEDLYRERAENTATGQMVSDTAQGLQDLVEHSDSYTADDSVQKEAQTILKDWKQVIDNRQWSANVKWLGDNDWEGTGTSNPTLSYHTPSQYSDEYYCEFVTNDKDPFNNQVIIHNKSAVFDIKYITVTNKTGKTQVIDNVLDDSGKMKKDITIDCPAGKAVDENGNSQDVFGIDSIDDLKIDVYFDMPKTTFNVTLNYYALMGDNYKAINIYPGKDGVYELTDTPPLVETKEITCKVMDGFTLSNNVADGETGEKYIKDYINYYDTEFQFSSFIQTHLTESSNNMYKLDMTSDNPLAGTDVENTVYTQNDISVDLYYKMPDPGKITYTLTFDPDDAKSIIEEMGQEAGVAYIKSVLEKSQKTDPKYGLVNFYQDYTFNPDASLDSDTYYQSHNFGQSVVPLTMSDAYTENVCGNTNVLDGEKLDTEKWYYCKQCGLYYTEHRDHESWWNAFSPYVHQGDAYKLVDSQYVKTTKANCNPSASDESACSVIVAVTSTGKFYYNKYDYDENKTWICANGHINKITDQKCTHTDSTSSDSFYSTFTYKATMDDVGKKYFWFVADTRQCSDFCYTPEVARKDTMYIGGDVNYNVIVSRGGITKLKIGENLNNKFIPSTDTTVVISAKPYELKETVVCSKCGKNVAYNNDTKQYQCLSCSHVLNFFEDGVEVVTSDNNGEIQFRTPSNITGTQYYVSFPDKTLTINGNPVKISSYEKFYNANLSKRDYTFFDAEKPNGYIQNKDGVVSGPAAVNNVVGSHNRSILMFQKEGINVHFKFGDHFQQPNDSSLDVYVGVQVYKLNGNEETLIDEIYTGVKNLEYYDFTYVPSEKGQYKFVPCFYTVRYEGEYLYSGKYCPASKIIKIQQTGGAYNYSALDVGLASLVSQTASLGDTVQVISLCPTDNQYNQISGDSVTVNYTGSKKDIYFKSVLYDTSYDIDYSFCNTSDNIDSFKLGSSTDKQALKFLQLANFEFKIYDKNKKMIDTIDINSVKSRYSNTSNSFQAGQEYSIFEGDKQYVYYEHNGYLYFMRYSTRNNELNLSIVDLDLSHTNEKYYVTLEATTPFCDLSQNDFAHYNNFLTIKKSYDVTSAGGWSNVKNYDNLVNYPVVWDYDANVSELIQACSPKKSTVNKIVTEVRFDNLAQIAKMMVDKDGNTLISSDQLYQQLDFSAAESKNISLVDLISEEEIENIANQIRTKKDGSLSFTYYSQDKYDYHTVTLNEYWRKLPYTEPKTFDELSSDKIVAGGCEYDSTITVNDKKCLYVLWNSPTLVEDIRQQLSKVTVKYKSDTPGVVVIGLCDSPGQAVITQKINISALSRGYGGYGHNAYETFIANADLNTGLFYNTTGTAFSGMQEVLDSLSPYQQDFLNDTVVNKFASFLHYDSNYYSNGKYAFDPVNGFPAGTVYKAVNRYIDVDNKVYVDAVTGSFENGYLTLKYLVNLNRSDLASVSTFTGLISFENTGDTEFDGDFPVLKNNDIFSANFINSSSENSTKNVTLDQMYSDVSGTMPVLQLENSITLKTVKVNVVLDKGVSYKRGDWKEYYFGRPVITDNSLGGKTLTFNVPVQSFKSDIEQEEMAPRLIGLDENEEYVVRNENNKIVDNTYFDFSSSSTEDIVNSYTNGVKSVNGVFLEYDYYGEDNADNSCSLSAQYIYKDTTIYISKKAPDHSIMTSITPNAGVITAPIADIEDGTNRIIGFTPDNGYYVSRVIVDGVDLTQEEINLLKNKTVASDGAEYEYGYVFNNIKDSHDIKVVCEAYLCIDTNIKNGVITPSVQNITNGDSETITFTPNDGYYISEIVIDGNSNQKILVNKDYSNKHNNDVTYKNGKWTFDNITANHQISVVCEKKPTVTFESYVADRQGNETLSTGMFDKYSNGSSAYVNTDKSTKDSVVISVYPEDTPSLSYDGSKSGYYVTSIEEFNGDQKAVIDYSDADNMQLDAIDSVYNQPKYLATNYSFTAGTTSQKYVVHWDKIYIDIEAVNTEISQQNDDNSTVSAIITENKDNYIRPITGNYSGLEKATVTAIRHESVSLQFNPYEYAYLSEYDVNGNKNTNLSEQVKESGSEYTFVDLEGKESNSKNNKFTVKSELLTVAATIDNNNTLDIFAQQLDPVTLNKDVAVSVYNMLGVKYGTDVEFKINLRDGYEISSLTVDGKNIPLNNIVYRNGQPYYIVRNVKEDTIVDIRTKCAPSYDVETWISNGVITASAYNIDPQTEPSKLVSFKPNEGYEVTGIRITRSIDGVEKSYTIDNVNNYRVGGDYVVSFDQYEWNKNPQKQIYKVQVTCQKIEYSASLVLYLHKDAVNADSTTSALDETMFKLSQNYAAASDVLTNKNLSGYYNSDDFPYYRIFYFDSMSAQNPDIEITSVQDSLSNEGRKYDYCFESRIENGVLNYDTLITHIGKHTYIQNSNGQWITAEAGCYIQSKPLEGIKVEFIYPNKSYVCGQQVVATFKVINDTDIDLVDLNARVRLMIAQKEARKGLLVTDTNDYYSVWASVTDNQDDAAWQRQDTEINTKVSVPAHGSNIFYVKFVVPEWDLYDVKNGMTKSDIRGIVPCAEVYGSPNVYAISQNVAKDSNGYLLNKSWITVGNYSPYCSRDNSSDINGGSSFVYSDSKNDKTYQNTASWEQWEYDADNGFVKHTYSTKVKFSEILLRPIDRTQSIFKRDFSDPDNQNIGAVNPSQGYDEGTNTWTSKSGYGLQLNVPMGSISVVNESGVEKKDFYANIPSTNLASSYGGETQNAQCFFSEHGYSQAKRYSDTLGKVVVKNGEEQYIEYAGDYSINSQLQGYTFTVDNQYLHSIPVWYPDDTNYKVQVLVSGAWTPAGALSYVGDSNNVVIKGSLFEDYKSRETSLF